MAEKLEEEMVASYAISIEGVERTKSELAKLTDAISLLRKTEYSEGITASEARFGTSRASKIGKGRTDIFSASVDHLEGRVQTKASKVMAHAMSKGKQAQTLALRAAETETGKSGKPKGRKGPGREVHGELIGAVATNVETQKTKAVTLIVGWHGWPRNDRERYFEYQEQGTKGRKPSAADIERARVARSVKRSLKPRRKSAVSGRGVPAANSLGAALPVAREELKKGLKDLL